MHKYSRFVIVPLLVPAYSGRLMFLNLFFIDSARNLLYCIYSTIIILNFAHTELYSTKNRLHERFPPCTTTCSAAGSTKFTLIRDMISTVVAFWIQQNYTVWYKEYLSVPLQNEIVVYLYSSSAISINISFSTSKDPCCSLSGVFVLVLAIETYPC